MFYSKNNSLTYEPVKIESNCDICGRHEMLLSSINLFATFGSKNDLESRTVYACGDCIGSVFDFIEKRHDAILKGEKED